MPDISYNDNSFYTIYTEKGDLRLEPKEFNRVKKSVTYRFLGVISGECKLFLSGATYNLCKNDFCFFRPGDVYRTIPVKNMAVINTYFTLDKSDTAYLTSIEEINECNDLVKYSFNDALIFNAPFVIKNYPAGLITLTEILKESQEKRNLYKAKQDLLLNSLAVEIVRYNEVKTALCTDNTHSLVREIIDYIKQNIKENISVSTLAKAFGYHANYLSKLVKTSTGISLHRYIYEQKINSATHELIYTHKSIAQIAQDYSFYDSSHFIHNYYKITGLKPSEVRKASNKPKI